MTDWSFNYTSGSTYTTDLDLWGLWNGPQITVNSASFTPRALAAKRRRLPALSIAIGHAVFFLALALAGWLR